MLETMAQRLESENSGSVLRAAVADAAKVDEAERLKEEVLSRFDPGEFHLTELTAALGTQVGPGTLGLGWDAD